MTTRVEVLTDDHDESADNHSTNYEFLDLGQESIRQISEAENNESSSDIREFSVNFQEFDNFLKTNLDVGWEIKDEEIEASED